MRNIVDELLKCDDATLREVVLVGFMHSELIHTARNLLGAAKRVAYDITNGRYDGDSENMKAQARRITMYVNEYINALDELPKPALFYFYGSPSTILDIHEILDSILVLFIRKGERRIKTEYRVSNPKIRIPTPQLHDALFIILNQALHIVRSEEEELTVQTEEVQGDGCNFVQLSFYLSGRQVIENKTLLQRSQRIYRNQELGLIWADSFLKLYGGEIQWQLVPQDDLVVRILLPLSSWH